MRGWALGVAGGSLAVGLLAFACGSEESGGSSSGGTDAGTDTSTTRNGDATTSGDGTVGPGPTGPIDPAAAARAALFIASCTSDDGVQRTLEQLYLRRTTNAYRSRAVIDCLASKANGCAAMTDCIGIRYSGDGGCGDASCVDNVYNECQGAGFRLSVDCTKTGRTCVPQRSVYCAGPGETVCTPETTAGTCEGTTPVSCVDGLTMRGTDCAVHGTTCGVLYTYQTGGSMMGCKGTGPACTAPSSDDDAVTTSWRGLRCENGKLVGCVAEAEATLDCAQSAVGFTCFDAPDSGVGFTAYCGTSAECSRLPAACDGTSVVMCNGGKIEKLDCTALGFTGCNAGVCTPGFL
jgi:hypothetical protein